MTNRDHSIIAKEIANTFYDDPAGYAEYIIGMKPDDWQVKVAESVRDNRRTAVRAAHGPGKSWLAAVLIKWWMATRGYPRIRSTANTEKQIMSILWSELGKIHRASKDRELYEWTKTGYFLKGAADVHWAQAIAWSENNSEAFAGLHSPNVLYIFDESSAIPPIIWEVAQGAMTNSDSRWLVLGNPTRNNGNFFECFGKNSWKADDSDSSLWHGFTISAFDSPRVSQEYINEIEREYGKDSDPYRVRVLGLPPQAESQQFISREEFEEAMRRPHVILPHAPRILGVDVARFGDDRTAIVERTGSSMRVVSTIRGQDTMKTAGQILDIIEKAAREQRPIDYVCVDVVGIGAGVVDRLNEQHIDVVSVNVGEKPFDQKFKNRRSELWHDYKDWLQTGSVDESLLEDTCGIQFSFDSSGRLVMERKEDMKKRGLSSPDLADAACLTFSIRNPIKKAERKKAKQVELDVITIPSRKQVKTGQAWWK